MADNSGNYQVAVPTALYAPDPYVITNHRGILGINRQGEFGINAVQTNYGDPTTPANLLYGQTSNPGTVEPVAMFGDTLFGVSGWAMYPFFAIGDNGRMAFNRTVYQKDGSFNSYFVFAQRLNPAVSLEEQAVLAGETITVKGANQICYSDGEYSTMIWLNGQGLYDFNCTDSQTITFPAPATQGKYVVKVGLLQSGDWSNPLLTNGNGTSFTVMPPSWHRRHVVNP